jgi:hypothetical protein
VSTTERTGDKEVPKDLIHAVVHLVSTGPVPLGAYTLAEIDAVNGVIDLIEREPAPELVAEAVRSLAARNLITTTAGVDEIQVRGDLGIALAFQTLTRARRPRYRQRAGPAWRFLLMPSPRGDARGPIDALGIHFTRCGIPRRR